MLNLVWSGTFDCSLKYMIMRPSNGESILWSELWNGTNMFREVKSSLFHGLPNSVASNVYLSPVIYFLIEKPHNAHRES